MLELIGELGFDGGKTLVYDYVAELRPLYAPRPRTFQRTVYRRGELLQFDLWQPRAGDPGRLRPDPARLGRGRRAGLLARGRRDADLLQAGARHPRRSVALHRPAGRSAGDAGDRSRGRAARRRRAPDGRVRRVLRPAASAGILRARRSAGQGPGRAAAGLHRDELRARPRFVNHHDFQDQLDGWFDGRANRRLHRTLRRRPLDLLAEELEAMRRCLRAAPASSGAGCCRVPPDPHLRFDTNDYSLDPRLGRPARRGLASTSARSPRSRSTPASWPAATSAASRGTGPSPRSSTPAPSDARRGAGALDRVEIRPLARYDALIPA